MQFYVTRHHGDFAVIMSFKPIKLMKVTKHAPLDWSEFKNHSLCIDQRKKIYPVVFPRGKKTVPNKRSSVVNIHTMEHMPSTPTTQNQSVLTEFNSQVSYRIDVTMVTAREL